MRGNTELWGQPMPIAQLLLCWFLQSFPPGGFRLSHLPRQLVLASLQRSGSRRIPATPADRYFRYIAESVVNADFSEAKRNIKDVKNKYCILLLTVIDFQGKQSGSIFELFCIM